MKRKAPPVHARVERFSDGTCLSSAAARYFIRSAKRSIEARGRFAVALAGGSTPGRLYERLAAMQPAPVDWERVEFFFGDERAVSPDDAESNYRFARERLLIPIGAARSHIHRMCGEASDLDQASRDYQGEIARVFDVDESGDPPNLDLILLGMGGDGHTASLFPGSDFGGETEGWVECQRPEGLAPRITLTVRMINNARDVIFLVSGREKAETLAAVLTGDRRPMQLPAQRIVPCNGCVTWLVDDAAAAGLARQGELA